MNRITIFKSENNVLGKEKFASILFVLLTIHFYWKT